MPTTPAGTAYTVQTFTTSAGETGTWAVSNAAADDFRVPLVLFCHGNPGSDQTAADTQFTTNYADLRAWLMDNGWAYVEGHGAGANWGNTASRTAYRAMYQDMTALISVGDVVVIGRSMGAIVAQYLASRDAVVSPRCVGLVFLSGTLDLTNRYSTAGSTDQTNLLAAYGVSSEAALKVAVADFDPMNADLAVWYGRRVRNQYDTDDATVPPTVNAIPWANKFSGSISSYSAQVSSGGDHNTSVNAPAQVAATIAALNTWHTPAAAGLITSMKYKSGTEILNLAIGA